MNILSQIDVDDSVYIWGCGLAGRWLNMQLSKRVSGFIDSDIKKVGRYFGGVPVYSVADVSEKLDCHSVIIVTIVDIQDVVDYAKSLPAKKIIPLGLYLNDVNASADGFEESAEFVSYSLKAVEVCHKGYYSEDKLFLRSVDLIITEKCSLRCRDCSNLMQYYELPKDISYDELKAGFDGLMKHVDEIYEVRVIGGEPFMNKNIYDIVEMVARHPRVGKVVVYSNAMVSLNKEKRSVLAHEKVVLSLTDYGALAKNTHRVTDELREIGGVFRLHTPENWTDSGVIQDFNRTVDGLKKIFAECCGKNLITQSAGRLYRCPFAANADRLRAVPFDKRNFVEIDAGKLEIKRYTREIDYLPACNYCKGRSFGAEEIVPAIQSKSPVKYKKFPILSI